MGQVACVNTDINNTGGRGAAVARRLAGGARLEAAVGGWVSDLH